MVYGIKPTGSNFKFQIHELPLERGKKEGQEGVSFLYVDGNMIQRSENIPRGPVIDLNGDLSVQSFKCQHTMQPCFITCEGMEGK